MRTRKTYYVNAEHTGRPPRHHTREQSMEWNKRISDDYQRVTLAQARAWAKLPHTAANAWYIAAAAAVLEYAK